MVRWAARREGREERRGRVDLTEDDEDEEGDGAHVRAHLRERERETDRDRDRQSERSCAPPPPISTPRRTPHVFREREREQAR
eukprot:1736830-Rhodomonas_salina.1